MWAALTNKPFNWEEWWPQLQNVHDLAMKEMLVGSTFSCTWRAPMGYKLRTDIVIDQVVELKKVRLHSSGDLVGTVTCNLRRSDGSTHIDIDWQVDTNKSWMNHASHLLRPIFVYNHHAVMRSGARGLSEYLQSKKPR